MKGTDKLNFGRTIAEQEGNNHMMNDCERYGMISGCDEDCPVLQKGDCTNTESRKLFPRGEKDDRSKYSR